MRRREFITLMGGAAAAWPVRSPAQTSRSTKTIGVLMNLSATDPDAQRRITAFVQGLQQRGWSDGSNIQIEYRWASGDPDLVRRHAMELVQLAPDVILATGGTTVGPLKQVTKSVPIIFVQVPDPVGAGFVASMSRPGGNATGFTQFEYGISAKWLELLKQIAPSIKRVGVLRDSAIADGIGQLAAMQGVAPGFGVELVPIDIHDAAEIDRAIAAFATSGTAGLVVTGSALTILYRRQIIKSADLAQLPAVYPFRLFVTPGGLISYGPDTVDPYRQAARYVDRVLRGEKPADLPVQAPTKYELVINLKTAKALGLTVPPTLLARADEVIE